MDLAQFGEELKKQRLAQQISLADISSETRVNLRFLEAIERGDLHILPQTYVRAFLREYALVVGLRAEDVMRQYDEISGTRPSVQDAIPPTRLAAVPGQPQIVAWLTQLTRPQRMLLGGGLTIIGAVVVFLLAQGSGEPVVTAPREITFDRVIRENEAAAAKPAPPPIVVKKPPVVEDSLRLEITTTDTLWMSILIDGRSEEYLFPPNRKRTWTARERFVLTMGNAGGATFRLNGKDLGTLGRPGAVLRNTPITAATLKNLPPAGQPPL